MHIWQYPPPPGLSRPTTRLPTDLKLVENKKKEKEKKLFEGLRLIFMYETKAGSFPNKDHLPRLNIKLIIKLN